MGKLDGRCLCGAMTYTCDADPLFTAICHCKDCQRQSGTAFSIVVGVPRDAFRLEGDTAKDVTTVGEDHGGKNERKFCGECGSPLITSNQSLPDVYILKAGTLDDTSWLNPQIEVWGASAQPWVEPTQARPRLERDPQPPG
jgi:hypothetical protein